MHYYTPKRCASIYINQLDNIACVRRTKLTFNANKTSEYYKNKNSTSMESRECLNSSVC